jgi:hypothetical protein
MIPLYRYPALRKSCVKKTKTPKTHLASPCWPHIDPDQIVGIDIVQTAFLQKEIYRVEVVYPLYFGRLPLSANTS